MTNNDDDRRAAAERVRKHIEMLQSAIANDQVIMDLLQPEFDKFKAKPRAEPHNLYAVRMYVDHLSSQRKDKKLVADLEWLLAAERRGIERAAQVADEHACQHCAHISDAIRAIIIEGADK